MEGASPPVRQSTAAHSLLLHSLNMPHRSIVCMVLVRFRLATSSRWISPVMALTIASASAAFSRIALICCIRCWVCEHEYGDQNAEPASGAERAGGSWGMPWDLITATRLGTQCRLGFVRAGYLVHRTRSAPLHAFHTQVSALPTPCPCSSTHPNLPLNTPHPRRILIPSQLAFEARNLLAHIENLELEACMDLLVVREG
jgi:hypothetical protein